MAKKSPKKTTRQLRKPETIREKSKKSPAKTKQRRLHKARSKAAKPLSKTKAFLKREYHLPLPDNKVGRFLGKRAYLTPRFLRESIEQLKLVDWPSAKETLNLSVAVFVFAVFFGLIIAVVDTGLERLFRELIIR